jgi:CHASE3 domain sensor protein
MMNINHVQRTMRLSRVTQLGFGAVLVTMVGVGVVSKLSMGSLVDSLNWVSRTYEVEAELNALEKILVDAETGQRGFLFTNKEEFLEPYNNSVKELDQYFSNLRVLIQDRTQMRRLDQVEALAKRKMDNMAETIALRRAGREQTLREIVLSGTGKQIMDEIRMRLDEMMDVENELLSKRKQDAGQAEQLSTTVALGGTAAAIVLGSLSLLFIARKVIRPINEVANMIVSSSSEIAATVTQHASSVHQTTTTMDELGASSKQSAEQAEVAAMGARQVATA